MINFSNPFNIVFGLFFLVCFLAIFYAIIRDIRAIIKGKNKHISIEKLRMRRQQILSQRDNTCLLNCSFYADEIVECLNNYKFRVTSAGQFVIDIKERKNGYNIDIVNKLLKKNSVEVDHSENHGNILSFYVVLMETK